MIENNLDFEDFYEDLYEDDKMFTLLLLKNLIYIIDANNHIVENNHIIENREFVDAGDYIVALKLAIKTIEELGLVVDDFE